MSGPSLIAKGCGADITLEVQKRIAFLGLAEPLHIVPSPPTFPPCRPNSRGLRPSTKASCHSLIRRSPGTIGSVESGSNHFLEPLDHKSVTNDSLNMRHTTPNIEETILNLETMIDDQVKGSASDKKTRKRKKKSDNNHRKSKSKHRLKSARGAKVLQELEPQSMQAQSEQCQLQAFCSPIKIKSQPKRQEKPKVEYIHIRAKSQPERSNRRSLMATPVTVHARNLISASVESLSRVTTKTSPYATFHKQSRKEEVIKRITKVYLSDKQSRNIKELGMEFPGAPPATPLPDVSYEYVPSLNDIRSQRAVRVRLEALERAEQQRQDKLRQERMKQEKINLKEQLREKRRMQRRQIYALNAVMKELENKNFQAFCQSHGIPSKS